MGHVTDGKRGFGMMDGWACLSDSWIARDGNYGRDNYRTCIRMLSALDLLNLKL